MRSVENVIFSYVKYMMSLWAKYKSFVSYNGFNIKRIVAYMSRIMQTQFLLNV